MQKAESYYSNVRQENALTMFGSVMVFIFIFIFISFFFLSGVISVHVGPYYSNVGTTRYTDETSVVLTDNTAAIEVYGGGISHGTTL